MITADSENFEIIAEKLLRDAYEVRDNPCWNTYLRLMQTMIQVGERLNQRHEALAFADQWLVLP